jgi:hypothetical protein
MSFFLSNTTTYFLPLLQQRYMFWLIKTIIGLQTQDLKSDVKYNASIFTLWEPISSQQFVQYKLNKNIKIGKKFSCKLVGGCRSSKICMGKN